MPKVLLLEKYGRTYTLFYRMSSYRFSAGEWAEVPAPVAIELQKKVTKKGQPRFLIEDMPIVVDGTIQEVKSMVAYENLAGQKLQGSRQLRFEAWPFERW